MGAPATDLKPALRTKPRPIPRELRAKRDDEVREESSIVWRAEDAAQRALLRSQPLIRRLKHKAETAMNELKSTYALLFGERERETGVERGLAGGGRSPKGGKIGSPAREE